MDEQTKREKIKRFLNEPLLADVVKGVLIDSFLKQSKSSDVQTLAASRIAIDLLGEGWKELYRFRSEDEKVKENKGNTGL